MTIPRHAPSPFEPPADLRRLGPPHIMHLRMLETIPAEGAIDKEMAAAPNALSVTRHTLSITRQRRVTRSISKVPVYFGELVECPQLTDSPHFFSRRELCSTHHIQPQLVS